MDRALENRECMYKDGPNDNANKDPVHCVCGNFCPPFVDLLSMWRRRGILMVKILVHAVVEWPLL